MNADILDEGTISFGANKTRSLGKYAAGDGNDATVLSGANEIGLAVDDIIMLDAGLVSVQGVNVNVTSPSVTITGETVDAIYLGVTETTPDIIAGQLPNDIVAETRAEYKDPQNLLASNAFIEKSGYDAYGDQREIDLMRQASAARLRRVSIW